MGHDASAVKALLITMIMVISPVLLLSGCTFTESDEVAATPTQLVTPSPNNAFVGFQSFSEEYLKASTGLEASLPSGEVFPEEPPGLWAPDGTYEAGTGEVTAALYWRCAWAIEYVRAVDNGHPNNAAEALSELERWAAFREVIDHSDEDTRRMWLERVVGPARAGEDSALRQVASGCDVP